MSQYDGAIANHRSNVIECQQTIEWCENHINNCHAKIQRLSELHSLFCRLNDAFQNSYGAKRNTVRNTPFGISTDTVRKCFDNISGELSTGVGGSGRKYRSTENRIEYLKKRIEQDIDQTEYEISDIHNEMGRAQQQMENDQNEIYYLERLKMQEEEEWR